MPLPSSPARPAGLPDRIRHWIGGALADSADGAVFDVADPASNTRYTTAAAGGPADVDRAVAAARAAFPGWAGLGNRDRPDPRRRRGRGREDRLAELESFDRAADQPGARPGPAAPRTSATSPT